MIITLLAFTFCITGCGKKQNNEGRNIIKELIYSFDAKAENPEVKGMLLELEAVNSDKSGIWSGICDIWSRAYGEEYVNADILPDSLPEDTSLGIVVLGYELNPDGSMRDELIGRLNTAYDCARKYPNAYIILTGGGTSVDNSKATEADAMAEWMREKGIEDDRIIVENQSLTTLENATNTIDILKKEYKEVKKLAIVSSDYHIPWGVVNFYAVIQYEAYRNNEEPAYEIISNAGYMLPAPTYSFEEIDYYQKNQLWELEQQ